MTLARISGRPCTTDEAVARAAALLTAARFPLVFGLVFSTVEAQREAARIAELVGGVIDPASSSGRLSSLAAFAGLGLVTTSLGPLRQRADLVVFWGCDPDGAHPGFVERHAGPRPGRARLAVDVGEARGPALVEERLGLAPEREIAGLLALRAFVRGRRVEAAVAGPSKLPLDALRALAARLASCAYSVIVHEGDPPAARREPERAWALGALARDANRKACVRLFAVRAPGNAVGAENVLAWRTGFPAAVSFARGAPCYGPGELTGEALLRRRDVDAALLVGADPARDLSSEAQAQLARLASVRVGPPDAPQAETASVFIAARPFLATPGAVFRMDGVAIRHTPRPEDAKAASGLPSEVDVLSSIALAIQGAAR